MGEVRCQNAQTLYPLPHGGGLVVKALWYMHLSSALSSFFMGRPGVRPCWSCPSPSRGRPGDWKLIILHSVLPSHPPLKGDTWCQNLYSQVLFSSNRFWPVVLQSRGMHDAGCQNLDPSWNSSSSSDNSLRLNPEKPKSKRDGVHQGQKKKGK